MTPPIIATLLGGAFATGVFVGFIIGNVHALRDARAVVVEEAVDHLDRAALKLLDRGLLDTAAGMRTARNLVARMRRHPLGGAS